MFSSPQERTSSRERLEGTRLGAWQLGTVLGEGATAVVYAAKRLPGGSNLDAQVAAIKVLHPEAAANPKIRTAFQTENHIMMKLRHPNIVRAFDFGMEDGRAFLAMTLVQGNTLEALIAPDRRLGEIAAIDICAAVARALGAMHRQQVIHRDIKPGNILLEEGSRRPILFDLGAAIDLSVDTPIQGEVFGTPAFVSPEQARGEAVIDGRADIYSLGIVLYRLLTGRKPFLGTRMEVLKAHVEEPPVPPSHYGYVSPELEAVVLRAMAKSPDDRYADADACADALLYIREHHTEPPHSLGDRLRGWIRGSARRTS